MLIPRSTTQYLDEKDPGAAMIPFSGALEQQLLDDPDNAKTYLEENKTQSCLSKIIVTGFKALGLQYFFTVGTDEVILVFTRVLIEGQGNADLYPGVLIQGRGNADLYPGVLIHHSGTR